jgi:hypothetical protein
MSGTQPGVRRPRRTRRPLSKAPGRRVRRATLALVAALTGALALSPSALAALSNPPAAGPIVFPMRDFVSAEG